jgi:hypothetical protein
MKTSHNPYIAYLHDYQYPGTEHRIGYFLSEMVWSWIEVETARHFQPWDAKKHIRRKASAKTWQLWVNDYRTDRSPHVAILCDINPNWHAGADEPNWHYVLDEVRALLVLFADWGIWWTFWWYDQALWHRLWSDDCRGGYPEDVLSMLVSSWQPLLDRVKHQREWYSHRGLWHSMLADYHDGVGIHCSMPHRIVFSDFLDAGIAVSHDDASSPMNLTGLAFQVSDDGLGKYLAISLPVQDYGGKNFSYFDKKSLQISL